LAVRWHVTSDLTRDEFKRLLEACVRGSESAWKRLFDICARLLHRSVLAMGAPCEIAEDVVSDVFLRLLQDDRRRLREATFANERQFRWWLLTIARRRYLDIAEQRARETEFEEQGLGRTAILRESLVDPPADALLTEMGTREELEGALARLTSTERYYVRLCYFEGLKHREIAELAGATVGGISAVIARAKDKMREALKEKRDAERSLGGDLGE
jgi:RNA polymerase sigma factor (sigma-70 family)